MKGLLIKDIRLLLQQKSTVVMFVLLGLFLMLTGEQILAAVNYMIIISGTYSLSTISYDTHDNGMAFLMTLPAGRKEYVVEKYVLVLGSAVFMGGVFAGIAAIVTLLSGNAADIMEMGVVLIVSLFAMLFVLSIMIPVHIKYGAEKSRVVFLIMFGIAFGMLFLLSKVAEQANAVGEAIAKIGSALGKLEQAGPGGVIFGGGLFVIVAVLLSIMISGRIIEKKEF